MFKNNKTTLFIIYNIQSNTEDGKIANHSCIQCI